MADHEDKSGGGGGNSPEDFFFFLLFIFLLVAWVINGGPGGGSTAQNTDLTVGPGQLLSSPRDESERTQKKWYEFLKIATSSDEEDFKTGETSPYHNKVSIVHNASNVRINTNTREYITILYSSTASSPVEHYRLGN